MAQAIRLHSPNRRIEVAIECDVENRPAYSVAFDGKLLIAPSPLGLRLADGVLARGSGVRHVARSSDDRHYTLVAGKTRDARDHYRQLVLDLGEFRLVFRAYDDGIAFRYRIAGPTLVADELTRFNFAGDYLCWGLSLGSFTTGHEGEFRAMRASTIGPDDLLDVPLACQAENAACVIAEADLKDYAGLYLRGHSGGLGVQVRLSPLHDDPAVAVRGSNLRSPWRVVMIAGRLGDLIASTLITNLTPPCRIKDTSWIKPGKYAWDWWSDGVVTGASAGMTDRTIKHFIDFAAGAGLEYMLIDAGWYVAPNGDVADATADVTRSIPAIDLPALIEYGRQRNVGLFVWVHWKPFEALMDQALTVYRRLGLKGIKVDFMDRNDQEMVAFYHRLLAKAAQHRLMVVLHGAYPPTGLQRAHPHLLTQEGVMGAEYNKWSTRVTATHNVTLPFTRMLLGPMDYTPGGFRNVSPADFVARNTLPLVQTTRGHALAMYVVYDSPLVSLADTPDAYRDQPGLDFLIAVPTSWDETRFIAGNIGQFIVVARKNGSDWFVGIMTNETERAVTIPLDFLGDGEFTVTIYADGDSPMALTLDRRTVRRRDSLELRLAPSGGAAVHIVH
jgi:alpha-glucosidase